MPKIVILDGYTLNPGDLSWDGLKNLGNLTVYDRTPADLIIPRIGDADIVITNKTPLSQDTLAACSSIRYIGVLATGYNVVDCAAAKARGIPVTNIPTYGTAAVAQFAIGLLLEICHHIGAHSQTVQAGRWTSSADFCYWDYPLIELSGKTLGIIGLGRIGAATAKIAAALGMKVIGCDSSVNPELAALGVKYVGYDELFAEADVISLHCPLFPSTQGIINKANIARMKNGVIILNTSRGGLVVEEDLAAALNSGKVFAAAVDVVSIEPIRPDNPLLTARNCLITPHIAWAPKEARIRLMDIATDNLAKFLRGKPVNVVNS